jgi:adenylosuccinate lyase
MPHKRNPIICERICGLARLVRSNMVAAFENINLWHERDISHSSAERVIIPDTCCLIVYMIRKMTEVVKNLKVHPQTMLSHLNLGGGLIYSQRLLLELTRKGLGRPQAYDLVQEIALESLNEGTSFQEKAGKHTGIKKILNQKEIDTLFDPGYYLNNIDYIYKKAGIE